MPDPLARILGETTPIPIQFASLEACMTRPPCRRVSHEALAESLLREFRERLRKVWSDTELFAALEGARVPLCFEKGIGRLTLLSGQWETERVALALIESELVRRRVVAVWGFDGMENVDA